MGKIALFFLLLINGLYSLVNPWFGVTIGYLFNILGPQFIWWWNFQGLRAVYLIAVPTMIGFFISLLRGAIDFDIIKNKGVLFTVLYFLCVLLSYFWGPYVTVINKWRFFDSYTIFITTLKVFTFFLVALCCISDEKKIKFFALVLPISVLYLIYWANMQYLSGRAFFRLRGPIDISGGGIYVDENGFAMVFVVGIPFLFFLGWYLKRWYLRLGLWLTIPFAWHAVFLTASRGGLLGATFVSFLCGLRSPKKILGILLIPALIFFYVWQGGSVMKKRAQTLENYKVDASATSRLEAWEAGFRMMLAHPFTGVGIASFGQAFPYFSDKKPRVAHNTFIQIAAESGIPACCFYILFMFNAMRSLFKNRNEYEKGSFFYYLSDATLVSLSGFLCCSLFLSLNGFEIQFYLVILANSLGYIIKRRRRCFNEERE